MEKKPDFLGIIKRLDTIFATSLMLAIFLNIWLQIFSRVTPGKAVFWTVEMGEMLLAAMIWMGIGLAVITNTHVRFDMLLVKLPHKTKKIFFVIGNILFAVFLIILAYYAVKLLSFYLRSNSRTPALRWNKAYIRWPVLLGSSIGAIRLLIQAWFFATDKIPLPAAAADDEISDIVAKAGEK
jgi:TRAP-type C4-dicarboxylate transport system permease small subunit